MLKEIVIRWVFLKWGLVTNGAGDLTDLNRGAI